MTINFNHADITRGLYWSDNQHISELVIENPHLLRRTIAYITDPTQEPLLSFMRDGEPLSIEKDCDFIANPTKLNFNSRRAITVLLKILTKTSLSEDFYMSTNRLKAKIVRYIDQIVDSENFIFEVDTDDFTLDSIAKAINIHIVSDDDDFVEILTDYLSMMHELAGIKIFITLNLRSLLDSNEMDRLCHNLNNHQMDMLLIENKDFGKLNNVDRILVDADLCEI